jgi:glycosyltransferase involved in cell wall biosynthesis
LNIVIKNADAVIAMNQDMKQKIKRMYNRDIFIVPTGIDFKRFNNLSRKEIRASLNLKNDEKIILFIGNLRPVKGVMYLIHAMKFIIDKNMNVRLFIVGGGKERDYLENLVKKYDLQKYVTFFGRVSNLKISENLVTSDLFVLPSLSEGFPLVILEAMASGLPIIASNVGGLSEIIKDFENGFLVEPKNPEKIAEKVIFLLNDEKLRKTISKNNKEVAKKYSWENVIEKLEKIYFKLTNNV